ncbi:MAG TPA: metallophosphoesterase [Pilimelia sp.]|nr:metallophosphoesterase [Pilimelia sp.]
MTADPTPGGGAVTPRALVIAHVSDLHIGAHSPDALDSFVTDVKAARPALTVITGDLTMRARAGQFTQVRALLDQLPEPRLTILGNHDVPLALPRRLVSPYTRYQNWIEPVLEPVVRLPGLCALGLNSMPRWRWKDGWVSRRQADSIVEILGATPRPAIRLLAMHHPPFVLGRIRLAGHAGLLRALTVARVDLVLGGHTHLPSVRAVELPGAGAEHQLIEVVAGTATSRRTRGVGQSWNIIRVDVDTIVVQERHLIDAAWRTEHTARFTRPP